jgi:hypothetical protein
VLVGNRVHRQPFVQAGKALPQAGKCDHQGSRRRRRLRRPMQGVVPLDALLGHRSWLVLLRECPDRRCGQE